MQFSDSYYNNFIDTCAKEKLKLLWNNLRFDMKNIIFPYDYSKYRRKIFDMLSRCQTSPGKFSTYFDTKTQPVPMRRTIIGISTSSSLKQVNILEQIRPSGTLHQTVPIVGIWSSAEAVQLFCLSAQQFQRHFPVNNTGSYASEWKPSGRKRRPLFREINWITPTKRTKQGNSGSSSCIRVPCKQEARRIAFRGTKTMISRSKRISPRISLACRALAKIRPPIKMAIRARESRRSDLKWEFDEGKEWN